MDRTFLFRSAALIYPDLQRLTKQSRAAVSCGRDAELCECTVSIGGRKARRAVGFDSCSYLLRSIAYLANPLASSPPSATTLLMPLPFASAKWPGAERKITGPLVAVLTKLQLRALPFAARVTLPPLLLRAAR